MSTCKRSGLREEEGEVRMAKKSQLALRTWKSLRSWFNSLVVLFVALVLVVTVSITAKTGGQPESHPVGCKECSSTCDLFSGQWVYDNLSYPLYSERACKFMSDQAACEKFGREDLRFQNWRWQPHGCDLPRFNATKLLERLRGKRLAFVGDSLNRNQWISMVCLLDTSMPNSQKHMESNGSLISFKVKDYNASIDFYWAPLLVESNSDDPVHHRIRERIIRAQSIEKHARHWTNADILVFDSYLWWKRPKMKVLWGSFENKDGIYKEVQMIRSYEMALRTWSDWLEFHVDPLKTQLFFVSMSPTHFRGDEWGIGGDQNCYNQTMPITKDRFRGKGSDIRMMGAVEAVIEGLRDRGIVVHILNVTRLSKYRKDAHPSIYRKQWDLLTQEQISNPSSYADCIHWCLPGVPDVWNELLYAYIFSR